jgi:hypothetical protein
MSYTKFLLFSTLFMFCTLLHSQNPSVLNGVATYTANMNIGRKFPVPDSWNKIVINENVTITGSFYMATRNHPIEIMGKDRKTSIIQGDGSRPTDDGIKGRTYSAIRCDKSPDLYVHGLTITRPMKFHIHGGFGKVTVERCDIIAGTHTATTDGIHGGQGKTTIKDCYINVFDDALYIRDAILVENTTIIHNQNGGPFMTSWGGTVPDGHICVIRNCTVIANSNEGYNQGVFSWSQKSDDKPQTMHVKIEGTFDYIINPGKQAAPMYTMGRPRDLTGFKNATMKIDGLCLRTNSIDIRENPASNKVVFVNCGATTVNQTNNYNLRISINPTMQKLIISDVKHGSKICIYNTKGQLVYNTSAQNSQIEINTEMFTPGIHILQLTNNEGSTSKKLIIDN